MSRFHRFLTALGLLLFALFLLTACASSPIAPPRAAAPAAEKLEIFSWWASGSEAAALSKLYTAYNESYPDVQIFDATVGGAAGQNAQAVLKARLLAGDPPDSFQVRMGAEFVEQWARPGYMENLDDLYKSEGWDQVLPKGVLAMLSADGHYWSVPVNAHRTNLLWYNRKIFADNHLQPPTTLDDFFKVAAALQSKGITPLALGDNNVSASVQLFETVLIGTLGADKYRGLWTGKTDWNGPELLAALENLKKMLAYINSNHTTLSSSKANDLVAEGTAAMTITGSWTDAENIAAKRQAVEGWAPAPGNAGIFAASADTFSLPRRARNREATIAWLKLVGSRAAQETFDPVIGSMCARTDCDRNLFSPYHQSAMTDWSKDVIVPSLAMGAAVRQEWLNDISTTIKAFVTKQDVRAAHLELLQACIDARLCKPTPK